MAIRAKQYTYNSEDTDWHSILQGESVIALGMQGPAGTKFYLNGNANDVITLGATGIYELDLRNGLGTITALNIQAEQSAKVMIDILYESANTIIPTSQIQEAELL